MLKKSWAPLLLIFSVLTSLLTVRTGHADQEPKNARAFIRAKKQMRTGGGAGNNGDGIVAHFTREALIGIDYLKATRRVPREQIEKLHKAIQETRVYAVSFDLCDEDPASESEESHCDNAHSAKNYPLEKIILIDRRPLPDRYSALDILERRRRAVHEYAGIAELEIENHSVTAEIDDPKYFETLTTREEKRAYFQVMNDLYFKLPGVTQKNAYAGLWGKVTVLKPGQLEVTRGGESLLKGEKYLFELAYNEPSNILGDKMIHGQPFEYRLLDYSSAYRLKAGRVVQKNEPAALIFTGDCLALRVEDGELKCNFLPGQTDQYYWKGRVKKTFSPSFRTANHAKTELSNFSCKPLSDDRLLCRHLYIKTVPYVPVTMFYQHYEYSVHVRAEIERKKK